MPPNNQNPYDFIMNSDQKPKSGLYLGDGIGPKIVLVVIILVIIIGGFVAANSFLGQEDKAQIERISEVSKAQAELIRVTDTADQKAKNTQTKTYAMNVKLAIQSSQLDTNALLTKRGVSKKSLNGLLSGSKNAKNDAALAEAEKNNRYDDTLVTLIDKQLADYQKLLASMSANGSRSEKQTALAQTNSAKLLAKSSLTNR